MATTPSLHSYNHNRAAFSLLEVVAGLAVVALILIPTTGLMQEVLLGEGIQKNRSELMQLAQGKQNEFCHFARADFQENKEAGNFAKQGYPELNYEIYCLQDKSLGGIPDRLMIVHTRAWHDANRNRSLDANETKVDLWTSVARATP